MAVSVTPRDLISALDTNWAEKARENDRRGNANEANLKAAVEMLQNAAAPVRQVKVGATTYQPDANGLVTLPSGIVLPATTTAERDAITSPTLGQGIYNTTNAQPEIYTSAGWKPFQASAQVDVFTASGTWAKPDKAKYVLVTVLGGGGGGGAWAVPGTNNPFIAYGGTGGGYAQKFLPASALPTSVSVTVGAGGSGGYSPNGSTPQQGGAGGDSSFGGLVNASGGQGGLTTSATSGNFWYAGGSGGGFTGISGLTSNVELNPQSGGLASNANSYAGGNSPHGGGGGGSAVGSSSQGLAGTAGSGGTPAPVNTYGYSSSSASNQSTNTPAVATAPIGGRSGSGRAGDGGSAAVVAMSGTITVTAIAAPGAAPAGGGGGAIVHNRASGAASTSVQPATGGAGARGEVLVVTIF